MWPNSFLLELGILFVFVVLGTIVYLKFVCFTYWKRKGVPYLEPSLPWGNTSDIFLQKCTLGSTFRHIYREMSNLNWKYGGIYSLGQPIFIPVDLDMIKFIMTKEFNRFRDRGLYYNEEVDPLSAHLFTLDGDKWKNLRTKLSPTFTSGKMKMMFPIIVDCSKEMSKVMNEFSKLSEPIDIKDVLARFTTDVIGRCAFGIECNSLKDPNTDFRKYGKKFFSGTILDSIKIAFSLTKPEVLKFFNARAVKKDVSEFFMNVVKSTVQYREDNGINRDDFMSLLIKLKNNQNGNSETNSEGLTMNELAAQAFVFFGAGFETSSTTMTFCLHELCMNKNIQEKLISEIKQVLKEHDGQMTYESVMEMKYLDQVINETLRKYPPLPFLNRKCAVPVQIPGTDIIIEKGTAILISNYGIQMDPKYYPNPEVFDPERFSDELKSKRHGYAHMPFGEGPRNCIGMRFGLMQTKVGLVELLSKFKFSHNSKSMKDITYEPKNFILTIREDLLLNITHE